jgi:alpha-galactosidase
VEYHLENDNYQLALHPAQARWSLYARESRMPAVEAVGMRLDYRLGGRRFHALTHWRRRIVSDVRRLDSPHGPLQQIEIVLFPDDSGMQFTMTFALPQAGPLFLWKLGIENQGSDPIHVDRLTLLDVMLPAEHLKSPAFFSNGWGSWNFTGAYGAEDRYRRTRLGPFTAPMKVNAGTPQPGERGHFASDLFGVMGDRRSRVALLAGFLSQLNHFGSLEARLEAAQPRLRLWANGDGARLDPGEQITSDWACIHVLDIDDADPLAPYLDAVARQAALRPPPGESPAGWCSWYHFFQQISHETICRNLKTIAAMRNDLPLEVIQIDDGFETRVGDWFSFTPGFPAGLAPLAKEIRDEGFTPGLWLAPFILDRGSQVAKAHPDWLLRGRLNQPVNAGYIWDRFTTSLDLTHPEALAYTKEVVRVAAQEWGFPYLKLDFLYAAALPGRYRDARRTRAQVLRMGLEALREAAGEGTFLLGCGCPLGSAFGLVDAMRIGADVAPTWEPQHALIQPYFRQEPDVPAARNAIQNVLTRLPLHKRWWANDPDCLLLRPETHLSLAEVHSLATVIALSDGMLLLSDDLPGLPQERLRIAQALLPIMGKPARVLDWFDELTPRRLRLDLEGAVGGWSLLALFNWEDAPKQERLELERFGLSPSDNYFVREFWSGTTALVRQGCLELGCLPAHGVALLAVRHYVPDAPQYLGGELHISQGLEVRRWERDDNAGKLWIELERPGHARGMVEVCLPRPLRMAALGSRPLGWKQRLPGCYWVAVDFERRAEIEIKY